MNPAKIRVKVTRGTRVNGQWAKVGQIFEVSRNDFAILYGQGQAVETDDPMPTAKAKAPVAKLSDSAGNPVQTR